MATRNSEALALIGTARQSGSTHDFWAAKRAVDALSPSQARTQYRAAVRRLPLSDPATWMIARAVEVTLDTTQTTPRVVGEDNGSVVLSLRRTEREAPLHGPVVAIDATANVDRKSGSLAVSSLAVTSYDAQIGTLPLPVTDGRLDVNAVRAWNENLRRVCAVPAALIAPPQL